MRQFKPKLKVAAAAPSDRYSVAGKAPAPYEPRRGRVAARLRSQSREEVPGSGFPACGSFPPKSSDDLSGGVRPRPPKGSRVYLDTGLLSFPCPALNGSESEKRMTFTSGCAIIFRNDMKEAEK